MRYWDSSAIVPLLVHERTTPQVAACLREDADMAVWWGTSLECVSAIARKEREGVLTTDAVSEAISRLSDLQHAWTEVEPSEKVRALARRLLRVHPLRAADALQLAAALVAFEHAPEPRYVVCHDDRLRTAADREGLTLYPARLP